MDCDSWIGLNFKGFIVNSFDFQCYILNNGLVLLHFIILLKISDKVFDINEYINLQNYFHKTLI